MIINDNVFYLKFFACLNILSIFPLVDNNTISKSFLLSLIIFKVFWPIEPVDPDYNFFHLKKLEYIYLED